MKKSVETLMLSKTIFMTALCLIPAFLTASTGRLVKNPYADVDWDRVNAYRANFHCHTIYSDGRAEPDVLIRNYEQAGYHILAITDHDNYHTTREGEREVPASPETTWPWTRWIDEVPSRIWEHEEKQTSAFYPDLGKEGMLAIRGNELTTDPHIVSLFNDTGYAERGTQTDDERLSQVDERGGLSYYAHPSDYMEGGRWQGRHFEPSMEGAVAYYGSYILRYSSCLGIEFKRGQDIKLFDALLRAYYSDHDIFLFGSDDNHNVTPPNSRHGRLTLVLAPELTEEAVRHAMERGHTLVGLQGETYPELKGVVVDEEAGTLTLKVDNHEGILWIKNGELVHEGESIIFTGMSDAILRFEIKMGRRTFYSQAFYIR